MKYAVYFSGKAYVEADSPEEAKEIYHDGFDVAYEEKQVDRVQEVDEFLVDLTDGGE